MVRIFRVGGTGGSGSESEHGRELDVSDLVEFDGIVRRRQQRDVFHDPILGAGNFTGIPGFDDDVFPEHVAHGFFRIGIDVETRPRIFGRNVRERHARYW